MYRAKVRGTVLVFVMIGLAGAAADATAPSTLAGQREGGWRVEVGPGEAARGQLPVTGGK